MTIDGYTYVSSLSMKAGRRSDIGNIAMFSPVLVKGAYTESLPYKRPSLSNVSQSIVYSSLRQILVLSRETQGS